MTRRRARGRTTPKRPRHAAESDMAVRFSQHGLSQFAGLSDETIEAAAAQTGSPHSSAEIARRMKRARALARWQAAPSPLVSMPDPSALFLMATMIDSDVGWCYGDDPNLIAILDGQGIDMGRSIAELEEAGMLEVDRAYEAEHGVRRVRINVGQLEFGPFPA